MDDLALTRLNRRAFLQAFGILLSLMLLAGALTRWLPAGSYQRIVQEGRAVVIPGSFSYQPRPDYPAWRWLTAPLEVLGGPDGLTIITIVLFLLLVGAAFALLERVGLLKRLIAQLVLRFARHKIRLLLLISLAFMLLGGFFGIFEEVLPLVPLMVALAYALGWDALVGLGMSILATNMGFSAAVTNPFTVGIAQKLAGLPLFSAFGLRLTIFVTMYALLVFFLVAYVRRLEKQPSVSPLFHLDKGLRAQGQAVDWAALAQGGPTWGRALRWLGIWLLLIFLILVSGPWVPAVSAYALPLVGVAFFIGALGAARLSGAGWRLIGTAAREGLMGMAPAILLILMAASVKHIVVEGGILDTLLYQAVERLAGRGRWEATLLMYLLVLVMELFIASGSAKAFLLMPVLVPLADLLGISRQVVVLAYCFGDGFSNLAYPTNPVLLIALGLTAVSYPQWLRWLARLWLGVILLSVGFLTLALWLV